MSTCRVCAFNNLVLYIRPMVSVDHDSSDVCTCTPFLGFIDDNIMLDCSSVVREGMPNLGNRGGGGGGGVK